MVIDSTTYVGVSGTAFETALAVQQTDPILQYIQIGLSIITFGVTIAYTIWKWYRKATKDKKITKDEVDDLFKELEKTINKKDDE